MPSYLLDHHASGTTGAGGWGLGVWVGVGVGGRSTAIMAVTRR